MTTIDTVALRALADAAEQEAREEAERMAEYRRRKWFEPRWDWQYVTHRSALAEALRDPDTVRALCDAADEVERLRDANDRLGGMVEWLSEVIVDARDACQRTESITPMGSPEWVESGIAMRTTALREVRQVLDRERNANPSRYDAARTALAALVTELRALHYTWVNPDDHEPYCAECGEEPPCKTVALLDRHAPEETT